MNITPYVNSSDRRVVNKTLSALYLTPKDIKFKGEVNIMAPVIEMAYDADLLTCNYIYIDTFARYYYIDKIITGGQRLTFECHIDVLMSHASEIEGFNAILARCENSHYNKYLNDRAFKSLAYKVASTRAFPKSFTKDLEFVLAVAGGGA